MNGNLYFASSIHPYAGAFTITMMIQICFYYFELYDFKVFKSNLELMIRLLQSLGSALIVLASIYYFTPNIMPGRGEFLLALVLIGVTVICWRLLYNEFLKVKYVDQRILILGTGNLAKNIAEKALGDSGFKVIGFTAAEPDRVGESLVNPGIIGTHSEIDRLCDRYKVNRVIVANEERRGKLPLEQLMECKTKGIKIEEGLNFYEHIAGKIEVSHLHPCFIIFSDGFKKSRLVANTKRGYDLLFSIIGMIIAAPFLPVIAILIKLDSRGPVFYKQERVGKNSKPFYLIKFRSMVQNSEKSGPTWAELQDKRVTRIGRILRKARIDEIPQLFNVVKGEMSLVGPRPERPHFVNKLREVIPYYDQRYCVAPGITGWAQVRYPYGASYKDAEEKLKYDLYYIKNISIAFDLFIIFETIKIVLFRKGAR